MLAVVYIPWLHKQRASSSHEGALYAALDVIGQGAPALAQAIHDSGAPPPFSAHLQDGRLRLGCLTTDVFLAVAGSRLAYKAERVAEDSFVTILAKAEAAERRTVRIAFETPTAFSLDGRSHLLPEVRLVFGSLTRRWVQCGGPEVPDLHMNEAAAVSVDIQGRSVNLADRGTRGFTGYVVYRPPAEAVCWYRALALFGTYSGVGRLTAQGFGQMRCEAT